MVEPLRRQGKDGHLSNSIPTGASLGHGGIAARHHLLDLPLGNIDPTDLAAIATAVDPIRVIWHFGAGNLSPQTTHTYKPTVITAPTPRP